MSILFLDTETTGFHKPGLPHDHPDQPHLVQLAAMLCDDAGRIEGSMNLIVDPGVPIPDAVAKIHGITTARAQAVGVSTREALGAFGLLFRRAKLAVAHNAAFDLAVMRCALAREYGVEHAGRIDAVPSFCTMKAATPVLKLPPTERMIAAGIGKHKSPNLGECVQRFFGETLDGAHDAMVDVTACKRVYFHMRSLNERAAA